MNFIKKNIIFSIVAAVTILGSLFLIYLDWTQHTAISEANAITQDSQQKFDEAFLKGNKPVDLNIKMIKEDTAELEKRTAVLQLIFGKPYRKALLGFDASLKVSEDELYARMKKLFEADTNTAKTADALIPLLFAELEKEKKLPKDSIKNNQFMKFVSDVFLETVEKADRNELIATGYDIMGSALGLQRMMGLSQAHKYLNNMQNEIRLRGLIPGVNSLETVQNFTFNQYVQTFPSKEAVPDILNTMPIFEDIFRRMRNSRLERVVTFQRLGQPSKLNGDKYLCYSFSTTVVGTMDSIRNFLNNLLDAYKDNRVYVVTWIDLTSEGSSAEVAQLKNHLFANETSSQQLDEMNPSGENPNRRRSGRRRSAAKRRSAITGQSVGGGSFRILTEEEAESLPDYGQVRIGKDHNVTATLQFKYYCYVGDILKK